MCLHASMGGTCTHEVARAARLLQPLGRYRAGRSAVASCLISSSITYSRKRAVTITFDNNVSGRLRHTVVDASLHDQVAFSDIEVRCKVP
jgi:hypothetical protein